MQGPTPAADFAAQLAQARRLDTSGRTIHQRHTNEIRALLGRVAELQALDSEAEAAEPSLFGGDVLTVAR